MERTIYRFGRFSLDAGGDVLLRDGEPVSLTPKAIRILAVLVERRGRLVTKEELMKEIWPDTFVEEANVTQHVSVLRKVLADVGEDGRSIIETFPKRGYRFVGEVERVSETEADAAPAASAGPAALVRTRWRSTRVPLIGAAVILLLAAVAAATYYIRSTEPIPPAQLAVLPLQIVSRQNLWPLPWYLREFTHAGWWNGISEEASNAPVILVTPEMEEALVRKLYDLPPPGERELYVSIFERPVELRPGVELRGYARKTLWDELRRLEAGP